MVKGVEDASYYMYGVYGRSVAPESILAPAEEWVYRVLESGG